MKYITLHITLFALLLLSGGAISLAVEIDHDKTQKSLPHYMQSNDDKIDYGEVHKAWSYYEQGKLDKALEILKRVNKPDYIQTAFLLGRIYMDKEQYLDALNAISIIKPKIDEGYKKFIVMGNKRRDVGEEEKQGIEFFYYKIHLISGVSYFKLGNCSAALKDLLIYSPEFQYADGYNMIAICYYTAKNYTEALKYFMRAYDLLENDKIKNVVAYNIGNLYALQGDMDNAIKWLIIPLDQDRKLFLEKIRSDKDFDSIRGNQKFKEFLAEQERLLTK